MRCLLLCVLFDVQEWLDGVDGEVPLMSLEPEITSTYSAKAIAQRG